MNKEELYKHSQNIAEQISELPLAAMHVPEALKLATKTAIGLEPNIDVADMAMPERRQYLAMLATSRNMLLEVQGGQECLWPVSEE